ncbi:MAG: class I SAM-dependent methyltransferase [Desulfurivibrionaceae bacterium]|jgi:SAM-dependent methyltransferase
MTNLGSILEIPQKPTWRRYKDIFLRNSHISIYRALEYEALSKVHFSGRILDFGGGKRAHYVTALKSWIRDGVYESANISVEMEPTYLIAPGNDLPVAPVTFDMVLSVNTLEHIYDLEGTLRELIRVLKPGGRIVLAVPFLFRMHGCPDDYNRPTASWWREALPRFGVQDLSITPLVWDVMTTGLSVTEGAGPFSKLRRLLVPLYGLLYAKVRARDSGERYPRMIGESLANVALGYVITGVKHP